MAAAVDPATGLADLGDELVLKILDGLFSPGDKRSLRAVCTQLRDLVDSRVTRAQTYLHFGAAPLAACRRWGPSLQRLQFRCQSPAPDVVEALAGGDFKVLEELLIYETAFSPDAAAALAAAAAGWPALRRLTLVENELRAAGVQALARTVWPSLTQLTIEKNGLTAEGVAALGPAAFPSLASLRLRGNAIHRAGAEALARTAWPQLRELCLEDEGLDGQAAGVIAAAAATHWPGLRALSLGSNSLAAGALEHSDWSDLEELDLGRIGMDHGCVIQLAPLARQWAGLRTLKLGGNPLQAAGIAELDRASLPHLRELHLQRARLGVDGAAMLAFASSEWPALRALRLRGNALRAAGVLALARATWPALEELHLSNNNLGAEGAGALAGVAARAFPALHTLNLADNELGDAGVRALVGGARCPTLCNLGLCANEIGMEGSAALGAAAANLPALRRVTLAWNEVGFAGAEALARGAWPRLLVAVIDPDDVLHDQRHVAGDVRDLGSLSAA
jgi:Ran GTPase-activating protein (RanGAP) involved in mRNA processing and transport